MTLFEKSAWLGLMAAGLSLAAAPSASAQMVVQGTIPPRGAAVVVLPTNPKLPTNTLLKFLFSAPAPVGRSGGYSIAFCVGPASNPCGTSTSYVVSVNSGTSSLALVDSSAFVNGELAVSQGTSATVPFSVTIE